MNPGEDRIQFVVWRQERAGVTGHWDHFQVAASRDMTVLDALRRINEEPVIEGGIEVSSVALDGDGDFGVNVNGVATLAGSARVADLDAPVVVEPLAAFPVARDLRLDRSRFATDLQAALDLAPEGQDVAPFSEKCAHCGLCMEASSEYGAEGDYIGPAVVHVLAEGNRAPGGDARRLERMDLLMGSGGVAHDSNTFLYSEACPQGWDLVRSIAGAKRSATLQWIRDFFQN